MLLKSLRVMTSDSRDREREGDREGWQSRKETGRKKIEGVWPGKMISLCANHFVVL